MHQRADERTQGNQLPANDRLVTKTVASLRCGMLLLVTAACARAEELPAVQPAAAGFAMQQLARMR
jgi:hypothetical protein